MNEIVGKNAQGKTSLLEALFLCVCGSSFRTGTLLDVIRHGAPGFFIEVAFEKNGFFHEIQLSFDGMKKRIVFDKRPCESQSMLIGELLGVVCPPEVQSVMKGAPQERRQFLDLHIAQLDPLYVHHLIRYRRALKQRNVLLRKKDTKTLHPWEKELAASGSYLICERIKAVRELVPWLKTYLEVLGVKYDAEVELSYATKRHIERKDELQLYLEKELFEKRGVEVALGSTLVGPHRDDLLLKASGKLVRDFASEGQLRLIALALKLSEWQRLKAITKEVPLLLIDDFEAYLDREKSEKLFSLCAEFGQLFVSAHRSICLEKEHLQGKSKTFYLECGNLCENIFVR
jgi:DNA replication and repair protein RecF